MLNGTSAQYMRDLSTLGISHQTSSSCPTIIIICFNDQFPRPPGQSADGFAAAEDHRSHSVHSWNY